MERKELLQKVGSMQQLAFIRPVEFREGRARGMAAYDVKNGELRFQVLTDKCLDIGELSYKGVNLSFLAKQGLIGRMDYDTHGEEGVRTVMGGLLFTCGLENTCLPCEVDGAYLPMHGRVRSAPAEHCQADAAWQGGRYTLRMSGKVREAELFGKNLTLSRTIETVYGERSIRITDEIENVNFTPEPMMVLYHFNLGYPLLDEGSEVVLPSRKQTPRDEAAKKDAHLWNRGEAPAVGEPERVYLHDLATDADGSTFACLLNDRLGIGVKIAFEQRHLPRFAQWKSLAAGDYVMGLEPTNSGMGGRAGEGNAVHTIAPFEKEVVRMTVRVLEGREELAAVRAEAAAFLSGTK